MMTMKQIRKWAKKNGFKVHVIEPSNQWQTKEYMLIDNVSRGTRDFKLHCHTLRALWDRSTISGRGNNDE